jgi:hypothetical protein
MHTNNNTNVNNSLLKTHNKLKKSFKGDYI